MLNQNGIFSQYIDVQNPDNLANVHKEYLDSDLVRLGVFGFGLRQSRISNKPGGHFQFIFSYQFIEYVNSRYITSDTINY